MSHFSKDALDIEADELARLRTLLHGREPGRVIGGRPGRTAPTPPTLAERFGVAPAGADRTTARRVPERSGST